MKFFLSQNAPAHSEVPRLLRRETPCKRCPGGREDARGAVCYTSQLRIGAWNCGGFSDVTMTMCKDLGFDILALPETHGTRPTHARAPPGAPSAVKLRQTYSRDTCFGSSFRIAQGDPSRCAAHTFKLKLPKEKSPTFLVVHVDSRRRGTTSAAAGGIAEKGSDRPRRGCALKLPSRISALL